MHRLYLFPISDAIDGYFDILSVVTVIHIHSQGNGKTFQESYIYLNFLYYLSSIFVMGAQVYKIEDIFTCSAKGAAERKTR